MKRWILSSRVTRSHERTLVEHQWRRTIPDGRALNITVEMFEPGVNPWIFQSSRADVRAAFKQALLDGSESFEPVKI